MLNSTTYSAVISKACTFWAGVFRHPVHLAFVGLPRPTNLRPSNHILLCVYARSYSACEAAYSPKVPSGTDDPRRCWPTASRVVGALLLLSAHGERAERVPAECGRGQIPNAPHMQQSPPSTRSLNRFSHLERQDIGYIG